MLASGGVDAFAKFKDRLVDDETVFDNVAVAGGGGCGDVEDGVVVAAWLVLVGCSLGFVSMVVCNFLLNYLIFILNKSFRLKYYFLVHFVLCKKK